MNNPLIELVFIVVRVLDGIAIPYALDGSVASSVFGEPRATMDVDIAVKVAPDKSIRRPMRVSCGGVR